MTLAAATEAAAPYGAWAYLVVFALMVLGWAGVPGVGGAVIAWSAVLASQGKLNIVAVLIVAAFGTEIGGLTGYRIGDRWGRKIIESLGRRGDRFRNAVTRAEAIYDRWGRLAVFFTPTMVSGILRMKYGQFVVWNFIAGAVYVLSIGPAVYGVGKVTEGHHDAGSVAALAAGLLIAAAFLLLAGRYYRRRKGGRPGAAGRSQAAVRER